eukprot:SAG31_NODE_1865_length_7034_cov_1.932805_7_plen_183_part_00
MALGEDLDEQAQAFSITKSELQATRVKVTTSEEAANRAVHRLHSALEETKIGLGKSIDQLGNKQTEFAVLASSTATTAEKCTARLSDSEQRLQAVIDDAAKLTDAHEIAAAASFAAEQTLRVAHGRYERIVCHAFQLFTQYFSMQIGRTCWSSGQQAGCDGRCSWKSCSVAPIDGAAVNRKS